MKFKRSLFFSFFFFFKKSSYAICCSSRYTILYSFILQCPTHPVSEAELGQILKDTLSNVVSFTVLLKKRKKQLLPASEMHVLTNAFTHLVLLYKEVTQCCGGNKTEHGNKNWLVCWRHSFKCYTFTSIVENHGCILTTQLSMVG